MASITYRQAMCSPMPICQPLQNLSCQAHAHSHDPILKSRCFSNPVHISLRLKFARLRRESDVSQIWFRLGSHLVQVWFRQKSNLVQGWFQLGSDLAWEYPLHAGSFVETGRQALRQTGRQVDGQTGRQVDRLQFCTWE